MAYFKTILAASAALVLTGSIASAATCDGAVRDITVTEATSCYADSDDYPGVDNLGNASDPFVTSGWIEIDDTGDGGTGYLSGDTNAGTSGSITVSGDLSMYDALLLGLKLGNKFISLSWAVFEIDGTGVYNWTIDGDNALSHVVLYGQEGVSEVPLPAAGFLLLGGLGGLAMMRRRSK